MADTRLTKIGFLRAIYLCFLALLYPKMLVDEEAKDNDERKNFSQPAPPRVHKAYIIRRAFWFSLLLILIFGGIGYVLGQICNFFIDCVNSSKITFLQIIGALFLLWGTLFVRGWEIQTLSGVTLTERVNRWLYRTMYCFGTMIIIFSLALFSCPND